MTTLNKFDAQLAANIATDHGKAMTNISQALSLLKNNAEYINDAVFSADYDLRTVLRHADTRSMGRMSDAVHHGAWTAFMTAHDAHLLSERKVYNDLTFSDVTRRNRFNDVQRLLPYTAENALKVWQDHISVGTERQIKFMTDLLNYTGSSYKNRSELFKSRMTIRSLDAHGGSCTMLARVLYVAAGLTGITFDFNKYFTEMRNNRTIDGEQFAPVHGLDVTIELHQNGNATMRMSRELVAVLNNVLGA